MCGPAAPFVMMAAAAAVSAIGSMQAGAAQKKMADYNAATARETGKYNADRQQERAQRILAQGRVNIAKSGVQMSGSPLDVLTDNAMNAEMDRLAILRSAESSATLSQMQGNAAQRAGYFGAATTMLSAAGKAYGMSSMSASGGNDLFKSSYANYGTSGWGGDL